MSAKQQMLEQLRRDKEERFGKSGAGAASAESGAPVPAGKKVDPPIVRVKEGIKIIKTLYTEDRSPGIAKTAFKTISIYLKNVLKVPVEDKF